MTRAQALYHIVSAYRRRIVVILACMVLLAVFFWPSEEDGKARPETTSGSSQEEFAEPPEARWTCAMHPNIHRGEPGRCPICGMDLVPVPTHKKSGTQTAARLSLTPEQLDLMRIQTVPVTRRFPTAELRLIGKVGYDETRIAHISAWVSGRIEDLFVDFTGVRVREGDHMVRLYSPELYSAQEELIQAAKALKKLSASGLESLLDSARGTLAATREKLRRLGMDETQIEEVERSGQAEEYVTIHAPTGGVVIERHASEGMYLDTGTRIFTIADLDELWVRLDAYESDLEWLRYGQAVEFTAEALPGKLFHGQVAFIDPTLHAETRTAKVRVNVDNREGLLKPEMFVRAKLRVRLAGGSRVIDESLAGKWVSPMHPEVVKDGPGFCDVCGMELVPAESLGYIVTRSDAAQAPLVIPASAVLLTGTRAVVYVEDQHAEIPTYEGREITLGPRAGDFYLVEQGLSEGELVVVSGNFKIDSALQIEAQPSMMNQAPSPGAT